MKYVEAMIHDPDTTQPTDPLKFEPDVDELTSAIKMANTLTSSDWTDVPAREWAEALQDVVQFASELVEDAKEHECDCDHEVAEDPVPLVPVSHIDTIARQLETAGFLRGEEVAIVRLSDLRVLLKGAQ